MTTEEHLEKIRARCVDLLNRQGWNSPTIYLECAEAGWRSAIAAIEWLMTIRQERHQYVLAEKASVALNAIISAWPEELLN